MRSDFPCYSSRNRISSDSKSKFQNVLKWDVTIVGFMCYMILKGKSAMAKARTEARGLGSCRADVPRFMRAFTPPRLAAHPEKRTQPAPVLILGANGGYAALGCIGYM